MSATKLALLCPGQGAQRVGMGESLAAAHPEARAVFDEAASILGAEFRDLLWSGPEETLKQTVHAQPALLVHSVAALRVLEARGVRADFAAGHSLGEYSAHVAAGSLAFSDALRLVRRRGELMHEAGTARPGTMAAVLGLDPDAVESLCAGVREAGGGEVVAANRNSPVQTVISGEIGAVQRAMQAAREAGARRVLPLTVSGAFHSPLMEPAAEGLRAALAEAPIREASFPVIANATAEPVRSEDEIRETLGAQLLSPVRWSESVRALLDAGVWVFVEMGSGAVLRGLVRAQEKGATLLGIEEAESVEPTLASLSEQGWEVTV